MKFIIHLHFYQPPRYDPKSGNYYVEESAYPFKNWNERISAECYKPIIPMLPYVSYNFGPTLIEWMKKEKPELFKSVVEITRRVKGAIFQPYYHIIMPLADNFMKEVNFVWGIRYFKRIFGFSPIGCWLPECAVDTATLKIMRKEGVRFTILGEDQVRGSRGSGLYRVRGIDGLYVFVFDRPVSGTIAFGDERFYRKDLVNYIGKEIRRKGIVISATDGETFGHHKKEGIRALKKLFRADLLGFSLNDAFKLDLVKGEVEVIDNTSWSCPHGLVRWYDHCGCSTGTHPGWNQRWRRPLREAMNWLTDKVYRFMFPFFEELNLDYRSLILSYVDYMSYPEWVVYGWLGDFTKIKDDKLLRRIKLFLDCYRFCIAMYTSCGWFFDDPTGPETQIVLRFAKRVVEILEEITGYHIEEGFLDRLANAKSNVPLFGTAREVYRRLN